MTLSCLSVIPVRDWGIGRTPTPTEAKKKCYKAEFWPPPPQEMLMQEIDRLVQMRFGLQKKGVFFYF